jgi:superfamily II DNA helicase RecQ
VPIYTLFTNEQLAEMARGPVTSLADLRRIQGVGTARIEKYGSQLLNVLEAEAIPQEEDEKEE